MSFHGGMPAGCASGPMHAPHHVDMAPHVDMHAHVDTHAHVDHAHVEHMPHLTENVHMDTQHMMVPTGAHQVYDVVGKTKMKKIPVRPGLRGKLFGPKVKAPVWKDIRIRPGGMKQDFATATTAVPHRSVSAHTDTRVVHHGAPPLHAHGTLAPPVDAGCGRYEYPTTHVDVPPPHSAHHFSHGYGAPGHGQVDFHSDAALGMHHDMHLPTAGTLAGTQFAPTIDLHNPVHHDHIVDHHVDHVDTHVDHHGHGVHHDVGHHDHHVDAVHHTAPYHDPHHAPPVPEVEFTPMYTGNEQPIPHMQRASAPGPPSPGAPQPGFAGGRRSRRGSANPMVGGREASIMA